MTEGHWDLIGQRKAGLRFLAAGGRERKLGSETKGFSCCFFRSPPLFLSSALFLAFSEEALMRIPLIIWGLTGTQTTLHLIPPSPPLGQQEALHSTRAHQHWADHYVCVCATISRLRTEVGIHLTMNCFRASSSMFCGKWGIGMCSFATVCPINKVCFESLKVRRDFCHKRYFDTSPECI